MLNCIYTFDYLVKCSFLKFKIISEVGPSELKYSIIKFTESKGTVSRTKYDKVVPGPYWQYFVLATDGA